MLIKTIIITSLCFIALFYNEVFAIDVYQNPVDRKIYAADKWQTYKPNYSDKIKQNSLKKVHNEGVILLSTQSDFEEVNVKSLADYIQALENLLEESVKKFTDSGEIIIQVELSNSTNSGISISLTEKIHQTLLQDFYNAAIKIPSPRTKSKRLTFQVIFSINNMN